MSDSPPQMKDRLDLVLRLAPYTVIELAERSGVDRRRIYRMRASGDPKWSELAALADALDVPMTIWLEDDSTVLEVLRSGSRWNRSDGQLTWGFADEGPGTIDLDEPVAA